MGPGAAKATPGVISAPWRDRPGPPGGARDSEPGAHLAALGTERHSGTCISRHGVYHARSPLRRGDAGRRVSAPQPAQRPGRRPGHMAHVQGEPGDKPEDLPRATRQRHVLSATGRSTSIPKSNGTLRPLGHPDALCILHLLTQTLGNFCDSDNGPARDRQGTPRRAELVTLGHARSRFALRLASGVSCLSVSSRCTDRLACLVRWSRRSLRAFVMRSGHIFCLQKISSV